MSDLSPRGDKASPLANVDVAINVFAKPWQTALSVLSLLKHSGSHINALWLQFEPKGSAFDQASPYLIAEYIQETNLVACNIFQPRDWLARRPLTREELQDPQLRQAIRYQFAFENSKMPYLFLTHNDVYILKDIIGALKNEIGSAFSIGQLGQCWVCPAHRENLCREILGKAPCTPETYLEFALSVEELKALYETSRAKGFFARKYETDGFKNEFENNPWPLPECRINEWASLINLEMTRKFCAPFGADYPPGAFAPCGEDRLDISTPFFRDMHHRKMHAKHFAIQKYVKHWVGTGNKSPARYAYSEDRAKSILQKNFPAFMDWAESKPKK